MEDSQVLGVIQQQQRRGIGILPTLPVARSSHSPLMPDLCRSPNSYRNAGGRQSP